MQTACQGKLEKMPRNLMEMNALNKIEKLLPQMTGGECGIDSSVPRAEKV